MCGLAGPASNSRHNINDQLVIQLEQLAAKEVDISPMEPDDSKPVLKGQINIEGSLISSRETWLQGCLDDTDIIERVFF